MGSAGIEPSERRGGNSVPYQVGIEPTYSPFTTHVLVESTGFEPAAYISSFPQLLIQHKRLGPDFQQIPILVPPVGFEPTTI